MFLELRFLYTLAFSLFIGMGIWRAARCFCHCRASLEPHVLLSAVAVMLLLAFLISYSAMMKIKYQWLLGLQGHYYLIGLLPGTILFYAGIKKALRVKQDETLARALFYFSFLFSWQEFSSRCCRGFMSKYSKILVLFILIFAFFYLGFPLKQDRADSSYAETNPNETQRCNVIGDLNGYVNCSASSPRLADFPMLASLTHNINLTVFPFGYLFFAVLLLFITLSLFLI